MEEEGGFFTGIGPIHPGTQSRSQHQALVVATLIQAFGRGQLHGLQLRNIAPALVPGVGRKQRRHQAEPASHADAGPGKLLMPPAQQVPAAHPHHKGGSQHPG